MPLRRGAAVRFTPSGCTDSADGTGAPPGSCVQLANLVPDPAQNGIFVCRPAAFKIIDFVTLGFSSPGFISSLYVIGNLAYGTIATARNAGKDEPFCVNLLTQANVPVSGVTSANVPTSPPTTGAWTPPILAQVAGRVIVTHPGFPGSAIKFGWFDISGFTLTTSINTAMTNVLTMNSGPVPLGVQPGMTIVGAGIPSGTTVVNTDAATPGHITISQAATTTASGVGVTIAGGTRSVPLWGAGDTAINHLPSIPVAVAQFNSRAYYALGLDGIVFSDAGLPLQVSNNPNVQALLPGNGLPVTMVYSQMLSAPLVTTGIVQGLIAFQNVAGIQQITGDPTTSNLSMNSLPVSTGTASPLSVCSCEFGTAFVSPEGMRLVQFNGSVSEPIGDAGKGITVPFVYSVVPSRVCGTANAHALRFAVQNGYVATQPQQEWWWDMGRKIWTGPMSLVPSLIQPWQGADNDNTFVITPQGVTGQIWQSDPIPYASSVFIENGVQMRIAMQPTPLPDNGALAMNALVEMSIAAAFAAGQVNVNASDISGALLYTTVVPIPAGLNSTVWGSFLWGGALWGGGAARFQQWPIYWPQIVVFKQLSVTFTIASSRALRLGNLYMRYQETGYPLPVPNNIPKAA